MAAAGQVYRRCLPQPLVQLSRRRNSSHARCRTPFHATLNIVVQPPALPARCCRLLCWLLCLRVCFWSGPSSATSGIGATPPAGLSPATAIFPAAPLLSQQRLRASHRPGTRLELTLAALIAQTELPAHWTALFASQDSVEFAAASAGS